MKKRLFKLFAISCLIYVFVLTFSISVFAIDKTEALNEEIICNIDIYSNDDKFDADNYVFNQNSINELLVSYDASTYGKLKWDIPNYADNVGILNVEYESLANKMNNMGYGNEYSLSTPKAEFGYSNDIKSLFNETFGVHQNTLSHVDMPENWTVSDIINVAQENRKTLLGDYKESNAYTDIANIINTSSIFTEATKTLTMPENLSVYDCASSLSSVSNPFSLDNNQYYQNGTKYQSDNIASEMYSNYCNKSKVWIKSANNKNIDDILDELNYYNGDVYGLLGLSSPEEAIDNTAPLDPIDSFENNKQQSEVTDPLENVTSGHMFNGNTPDVDNDNKITIKDITLKSIDEYYYTDDIDSVD